MIKKIQQLIIKLTVLFTLQAVLFVNTACAQIEVSSNSVSYLSPALNISLLDFNQNFNFYFSERAAVFKQPDTIKARTGFNNDLYVLPFKSLFPQVIQYQLLNAIKHNLLNNAEKDEICDIQVKYSSEDPLYELFEQQGENKLHALIGNEILKQYLLPIKQTRNREWIALEGYNPPSKKRANPKTIEAYKRKWLLDSIPAFTGYTKKELKAKPIGALWIIYFQYKLPHEFGKRLIRNVKADTVAEFKVNISFKNKQKLEAYISISGPEYNVTIKRTESKIAGHALVSSLSGFKLLSFEQRIAAVKDEHFRQQMHALQSQKEDLNRVLSAIELLERIKDIDLADWQAGISDETREKIKQDLTMLDSWLVKTPAYFGNRKQEKYQAHQHLDQIIKKRGSLAYNNFPSVIEEISSALNFLNARVVFLFKGIDNRNSILCEYALKTEDYYFYGEVIKNKLNIARAAVKINVLSIALDVLKVLEADILSNSVFERNLIQDKAAVEAIELIRQKLEAADDVKLSNDAMTLVQQVEIDKYHKIHNILKSLRSTRNWLMGKNFTFYADELNALIMLFEGVNLPGSSFYQGIDRCLKEIDAFTQIINRSKSKKINTGFKQVINEKIRMPRLMLKEILGRAAMRNKVIKRVLPDREITDINQAIELLEYDFLQKTGYNSYEHFQSDLIEKMDYAIKVLAETQNGFYRGSEFVQLGELVPAIINRLQVVQMFGQAI